MKVDTEAHPAEAGTLEIFKIKARIGNIPIKLKIPALNMKHAIDQAHTMIDAACNITRTEGARIRKAKATGFTEGER